MKQEDLGSFFTDNKGRIYKMIGYCECPTVCLKDLETGEKYDFGISSFMAQSFIKLIPEEKGDSKK